MVYAGCKIYGPYKGKDNRLRICIKEGKMLTTISYPKYVMENYLNRYLDKDETVDHIDCNPLNNDISNLRILTRSEHSTLDVIRLQCKEFECPICGITFQLKGRRLHDAIYNRKKRRKAGPFCSKSCSGFYGQAIRDRGMEKLKIKEIKPTYIRNKDIKDI